MEEKTNILEEFKKQIVATVGIIITAAGGLLVANMENIFTPEEDSSPPTMEQTIVIPEGIKDTVVISKTIVAPPPVEEEKEYDW
jgi:hypothetical protein